MLSMTVEFQLSGPLFDGRADEALEQFIQAAERNIAGYGVDQIRRQLGWVEQHETGYYQAHIKDRATPDGYLITDSRVVYGPWLEGTSERNQSTRFKGYHTFRLMTTQLVRSSVFLAEDVIDPYLARMGGQRA